MNYFAKNLKFLVKNSVLKKAQIADKISCKYGSLNQYENAVCEPKIDKIIAISTLFNISTDQLLTTDIEQHLQDTFTANLVKILKKRKLGEVYLAKVFSHTKTDVRKWIIGTKMPNNRELKLLSKALHCESDNLLPSISL